MPENENVGELPLMERLKKAHYLARELSEHLTQAYLPRLGDLRIATKEFDVKAVSDQQVFDATVAVLDAEEFTDGLCKKLHLYLDSICDEMKGLVFQEGSPDSSARHIQPEVDISDLDVLD